MGFIINSLNEYNPPQSVVAIQVAEKHNAVALQENTIHLLSLFMIIEFLADMEPIFVINIRSGQP